MNKLTLILYGYLVPSIWTAVLILTAMEPGYERFDAFLWVMYAVFTLICYYLPYVVHTNYYKKKR
jgi:hypothetical protein